jgi:carboxyl-terminal processing protease
MSLKNAVNMMRGVIDTKVKLTIIRKKETLVKTITRAVINIIAVKDLILDESTGYIRISSFTSTSANDFRKSLISISDKGINSIIIDLRDNPGGQLGQVSDITDLLLPKGLNIVTTKSRNSDYSFDSEEDPIIPDLNLVILVNHGSASASEILAGAIQDHKMGIIAGVKTYGKGSVQTLFPMISGDAVKITTSLYYTPNGTSIQAKGISPDVIFKNFILDKESKNKPLFSEEDLQGRIDNPSEEKPKAKSNSNVKTKTTEKIKKMNSDPYIIQAKGLLKSLELK